MSTSALTRTREAAWRGTENAIRAQSRNKQESVRLCHLSSMLDKQRMKTRYRIGKEKRKLDNSLKELYITSGCSPKGLPPEGPKDRQHEKSPYFSSFARGKVDEKRLLRWRIKEDQFQRTLSENAKKIPPWEREQRDRDNERVMNHLMWIMENSHTAQDLFQRMQDATPELTVTPPEVGDNPKKSNTDPPKCQSNTRGKQVDVFECLRTEQDKLEDEQKATIAALNRCFSAPEPPSAPPAWEDRVIQTYTSALSDKVHCRRPRRRLRSTLSLTTASGSEVSDGKPPSGRKIRVRPTSAGEASRERRKPIKRIGSAKELRRIPTTEEMTGNHGDQARDCSRGEDATTSDYSLSELRKTDAEADEVNKADLSDGSVDEDIDLIDEVFNTNTTDDGTEQNDCGGVLKVSFMLPNETVVDNETDAKHNEIKAKVDEEINDKINKKKTPPSRQRTLSIRKKLKSTLDSIPESTKETQKPKQRKAKHLSDSTDEAEQDNASRKLKSPVNDTKLSTPSGRTTKTPRSKTPSLTSQSSEEEKLSRPESQRPASPSRKPKKHKVRPSSEAKNATNGKPKINTKIRELEELYDDELIDDDILDPEDQVTEKKMVQWRRDLMREAPPGIYSVNSPVKIRLALSKAQLKRDLDHLVVEHAKDLRETVQNAHARRLKARFDVFMTMKVVANAVKESEKAQGVLRP